jgi:formylglycine-generating enzyme required for sulfatase activity/predicted Ser/Thr protein kinase
MLLVGQVLNNRYRIIEPLGRGGMGSVFKARDDTLNRFVAIKELRIDPGSSPQIRAQVQQQFLQEAQVLANMNHPNLPRVTDYFTVGPAEYLVMDFIEGRNLSGLLTQGGGRPFDEAQVLNWARQMFDALAYCHARGVIHRDIKPQNLIVTPDGRVVLVDFGLAKVYTGTDMRTKTAVRGLGTPEYAPPEQYDSIAGHTDARSDIYALGATLYHLLTGQPPPTATQRAHNPASFVLPPTWHTLISPTTQGVILRALRIPAAERFASIGEMQAALFPGGTSVYGAGYAPGTTSSIIPPTSVQSGGTTTNPMGLGSSPGTPLPQVVRPWALPAMLALAGVMFVLVAAGTVAGGVRALGALAGRAPTAAASPPPATSIGVTPGTAGPTDTPHSGLSQRVRAIDNQPMVFVGGGQFTMGASADDPAALDNQKPAHVVTLSPFWIDRTEISNRQFAAFVQITGYQTDAEARGIAMVWFRNQWTELPGGDWRHPYGPGSTSDEHPNEPVVAVSWNDAAAYCIWAGARLPSEAEWEKAARGTDGWTWPWGDKWDGSKLNYCDTRCPDPAHDAGADDGFALLAPVDAFAQGASPYGVLNASGNVAEWVADWYDGAYYANSPGRDPLGPPTGAERVLRGGSWFASQARTHTTTRSSLSPDTAYGNVGFRCAMNP